MAKKGFPFSGRNVTVQAPTDRDPAPPAAPKVTLNNAYNVNPSLPGPVGVERAHSRHPHSGGHVHQGGNQVFNVTVDDTEDTTEDVDPDCGEDGDCEQNSVSPKIWN